MVVDVPVSGTGLRTSFGGGVITLGSAEGYGMHLAGGITCSML